MMTKAELEFLLRVPNTLKEISKSLERIAAALELLTKDGGK